MKRLSNYLFLLLTGSLFFLYSCNDDEDPKPAPTVTPPSGIINVENGAAGTATFTVSIAEGLTATYTAMGTNVTVGSASGSVSGTSLAIPFTAGTTSGAASVSVTVKDSENQTATATATINILAPGDAPITFNTNGKIPATAELEVGDILTIEGVDVASADGVKQVTVTVNGTAVPALGQTYTGNPTTAEYGFTVNTEDLGAGTYVIVFTAEDANGSTTSFSHALTVVVPAPVTVTSNISENTTWTSNKVWILGGRITVLSGATLTIEPGTVIKGEAGTGANATALLIARGAKLMAEGTATAPIIFTSVADEIEPADIAAGNFGSPNLDPDIDGLWGGLLILGRARISASNNDGQLTEVQIEGIPTSDTNGLYGGNDDEDNSGVIKYISIRHGGSNIGAGNEINGLTLGGVGRGTIIENVEVVANQDDGIEWFGGTVDVTNAVVWNCNDDAIDTDQSWAGTLDNFVVIAPDDHNFELDGPEGTYAAGHVIKNGYVIANASGRTSSDLINTDDNSIVDLENIFITGIAAGQKINRVVHNVGTVNFTGIVLDVPAENLADYVNGAVPAGVTAGTTHTVNLGALSWTWAAQAGSFPAE